MTQYNYSIPLTLYGGDFTSISGNIPLSTFGSEAGITGLFNFIYLFTEGDNSPTKSIPLTLLGSESNELTKSVYLFIEGRSYQSQSSIDLFLHNNVSGITQNIPLYIEGSGITDGAIPIIKSLDLFIRRALTEGIPLYLAGQGQPISGEIPLYMFGGTRETLNIPLSIPNINESVTSSLRLHLIGF